MGANNLLPKAADIIADSGISVAAGQAVFGASFNPASASFLSGDARTNQQPPLITQHTVWARNHNWHVDQLEARFGGVWTDDQIFAVARALNEAEWQHVVLDEYAVKLFGKEAFSRYRGYDPTQDATITNEYTTVANRFGHDQARNGLEKIAEDGSVTLALSLGQAFTLGSGGVTNDADLAEWVRGARQRDPGGGRPRRRLETATCCCRTLNDLTVLDTMRGRDHGVGDYNELREGLDLSTYGSFDEFARANRLSPTTLDALKEAYDDDISQLDSDCRRTGRKEGSRLHPGRDLHHTGCNAVRGTSRRRPVPLSQPVQGRPRPDRSDQGHISVRYHRTRHRRQLRLP